MVIIYFSYSFFAKLNNPPTLIKITDNPIEEELEFDFSDINFDSYIEFLKNNNFVKIGKIDDLSVIS